MTFKPTLCIAILTLNEARRIEQCIASARFADQIVVVDSGSSDDTVALASAMGAEVHTYADWQGFGEQRNRLLKHCTADYIFFLDADEARCLGGVVEPSGIRPTVDTYEVYRRYPETFSDQ